MPIDPRHDTEPRQRESSDDDVPWVTLGAKDNLNLRVEGSELHSNPAFTYQAPPLCLGFLERLRL
jgi:hypothetical protein